MAKTDGAASLADSTCRQIRADILGGRFALGQRLKLATLALDYGVSPNIVREALTHLASDKLVRLQPHQGFSVTALTGAELRDLTFVRIEIEGLALRRSIENGGLEWEAALLAAHHRLANTPVRLPEGPAGRLNEAYFDAHTAFHSALIGACDSPLLIEIRRSLHDASEMYRRLAYSFDGSRKDTTREHKRLVDAALARDADRAVAQLARHYENTTRICMRAGLVAPDDAHAAA